MTKPASTAEPFTIREAAGIVKLTALYPEDAADILDELPRQELQQLTKRLVELVAVARTYRGTPHDKPPLNCPDWCDAVISRHATITKPTPKPGPLKEKRS